MRNEFQPCVLLSIVMAALAIAQLTMAG